MNNKHVNLTLDTARLSGVHSGEGPPPLSPLLRDTSDIIHLVLQDNMSKELQKQQLRDKIALLKQQLREQEEDEELRAPMQEEEELHSKLASAVGTVKASTSAPSSKEHKPSQYVIGVHNSPDKKVQTIQTIKQKETAEINSSLQALTRVKFDMSSF